MNKNYSIKTVKGKKYKKVINEVQNILDILDEESRTYDNRRIHCVNVKRYNDYVDIDKLIKNYDLETQKKIMDKFTDNYINDIYDYFIDALSNSFMDELGDLKDEFGFYGRSGGWFGYEVNSLIDTGQDIIDEYNYLLTYCNKDDDLFDEEDINSAYDFIDEYNKYNNILIEAKKYNDNTSFRDELEYQIKEYLNR